MPLAVEFPPTSAEWTFFVATFVILVGPLLVERIGLPGIVGVILGGLIVGPFVLGWIERDGAVESLGDLGILVLMFLAGLELDLDEFRANRRAALTLGAFTYTSVRAGRPPRAALRLRARDRVLFGSSGHPTRSSHIRSPGARAPSRSGGGRRRRGDGDDGHPRSLGARGRRRVGRERRSSVGSPGRGRAGSDRVAAFCGLGSHA